MPLIDLETDTLHASAADTASVHALILAAESALTTGLTGTAGMAGDDEGAGEFAQEYDTAVTGPDGITETITELLAALNSHATRISITANNHSKADADSGGDPHIPLTLPEMPTPPAPTVPSALGSTSPWEPEGFAYVRKVVEAIFWPNGDPDRLNAAEATWHTFSASLGPVMADLQAAHTKIAAQDIPVTPAMLAENQQLQECSQQLKDETREIGDKCREYANHIRTTRENIIHELKDMLRDSVIIEGVSAFTAFFTAGGAEILGQAVEGGRLALAGKRILEFLNIFKTAIRAVGRCDQKCGSPF